METVCLVTIQGKQYWTSNAPPEYQRGTQASEIKYIEDKGFKICVKYRVYELVPISAVHNTVTIQNA